MTQDNLLVLLPPPDVARQVRRLQKAHYEKSGDFSPYSTPVALILGRCASTRFDRRTLHITATFSSDDVIKTGFGHVLRCSADLSPLQRELDLPQTECGILFSKEKPVFDEDFSFGADRFTLALLRREKDGSYLLLQ